MPERASQTALPDLDHREEPVLLRRRMLLGKRTGFLLPAQGYDIDFGGRGQALLCDASVIIENGFLSAHEGRRADVL
ncbi:MAG TPA: hypothetical protein VKI65_01475 [Gemmataceae bacterium]|nr:hypothetical protein [Gemmataceae bacterium]